MTPINVTTPGGSKTTASRSNSPESNGFAAHGQRFIHYVQSKVPHFSIDATNKPIIAALLAYFLRDEAQCQAFGLRPEKGLLLLGPLGCGKTTLMNLFSVLPQEFGSGSFLPFRSVTARQVVRQFLEEGYPVLARYGAQSYRVKHLGYGPVVQYNQPIAYCFDDLGLEQPAKHYGNDCNVMAEILLDRYEQFVRHGMITHLTSNLNPESLEHYYGDRVRSRLREMCNLVCFPAEAPDRRSGDPLWTQRQR